MKSLELLSVFLVIQGFVCDNDALVAFSERARRNNWCNKRRFGTNHTMCIYGKGAQPACGDVGLPGLPSQVYVGITSMRIQIFPKISFYIENIFQNLILLAVRKRAYCKIA